MKRINGFLDLDSYFSSSDKEDIIESDYKSGHYWLIIDGEKYYFKPEEKSYRELISYHVAKRLNIDAVFYDLARFNGQTGVISKNYCKTDCKYIKGYDILEEYFENHFGDLIVMGFDPTISVGHVRMNKLNNLEIITCALKDRYKDKINIDEVMYQFILLFIFCILTIQKDKTPQNWDIEEGIESVSLIPVMDNALSFGDPATTKVSISSNIATSGTSIEECLKQFLSDSSADIVELFVEKYNTLTMDEFLNIISEVEFNVNASIPRAEKNEIIENFKNNRENIKRVLEELNISSKMGRS